LQDQPRQAASADGLIMVEVDRTLFAKAYETSVLALENLTPHQHDTLVRCQGEQRVHIKAPAGAGKTYIAMHEMLLILKSSSGTHLLFVARNLALCLFVLRWLCARFSARTEKQRKMLSRIHVLFDPLEHGPRACALKADHIKILPNAPHVPYTIVVVDEAHHMYRDPSVRALISKVVDHASADYRLMLLSDISQSTGQVCT
jgi:superfamily II DNA or RNA helicase